MALRIVNCHIHTFTDDHVPERFLRLPLRLLLKSRRLRTMLLAIVRRFDTGRRGPIARYARILEVAGNRSQREVFEIVRGFYPRQTRFVVLPMDMELMGAGRARKSIGEQHAELEALRDTYPDLVIPFVAVDPRRPDVVATTVDLLERGRFGGLKLYPPLGYHPCHARLRQLYAYAAERGIPVLTHCSRPTNISYRGPLIAEMLVDPVTGQPLPADRMSLLTLYTDPDTYVPILEEHPTLRLCLAHFGGAGDWEKYGNDQWGNATVSGEKSWLAKILDLLRSKKYPGLYTDISYTVFADDEYVYLLKVLLSDPDVAGRVLFGSDFYVVESAELEERRRSLRVRALLGEELFRTIACDNPVAFLGAQGPTA